LKDFRDDLRHTADRETSTINKWVRVVHTFFVWAIYKGYCPRLRVDDLVALKGWRTEVDDPIPLDPSQAKAIFEAVQRHDRDALAVARGQHRGVGPKHDTPAMPLLLLTLLAGVRKREAVQLTWEHYRRDALDASANVVGEIIVPAHIAKTKRRRVIPLDHAPGLRRYLNARLMVTGGEGTIAALSYDQAAKMLIRLRETYGGPAEFTWQTARVTCSSYLTSAPSIFGASAHAQSASRLGHSWSIAQRHYASSIAGIAGDATTLEQALRIEEHVKRACDAASRTASEIDSAPNTSSYRHASR
jgi:integrase